MKKIITFIALWCCCQASFAVSVAFDQDVFTQIKNQYAEKKWLMLLWSIDCPPCFKELSLIKEMRKKNPDINVAIVNTDGEREANIQSDEVMQQYGLSDITTYYFEEGSADRNRYLIDPSWYGELPRSYFVDPWGVFHGKSGLVKPELLNKWLL